MTNLPTREQMIANADAELANADRALTAALDWLRSDWTPVGSELTKEQARTRSRMRREIAVAKRAVVRARGVTN